MRLGGNLLNTTSVLRITMLLLLLLALFMLTWTMDVRLTMPCQFKKVEMPEISNY